MRAVQVYSDNQVHSCSLTSEKWQLLKILFSGQATAKSLAQACCRAGLCPLVLKMKLR